MDALRYPPSRTGDDIDVHHGTAVPDPYRWLEDPDSDETRAWVHAQQGLTASFLARMPIREALAQRLREVLDFERYGIPFRRGAQAFWFHNSGLQGHAVLYRRRTPEADAGVSSGGPTPEVVLDPNGLSTDGTVGLGSVAISRDGRWLAYGVTDGGTDWNTLRVRDLERNVDLDDEVRWVKFSGAEFLPDGTAFLYARYPEPVPGAAEQAHRNHQIWLHRVGTPQSDDVLVFARPDEPDWTMGAEVIPEGNVVAFHLSAAAGDDNALYVADIVDGAIGPIRPIVATMDAAHLPITVVGRQMILQTDRGAPRHRLVAVDLDDPAVERWIERVPESDDTLVAASRTGDRLFLRYLHHAHTRVVVVGLDGTPFGTVPLPGPGTAEGFGGRPEHRDTYFSFTSPVHPATVYRYDLDTNEVTVHFAPRVPFELDDLHCEQIFVTSRDGTQVPALMSWKGELVRDGSRPVLLYGYGGFNYPLLPGFQTTNVPWFELGGVYVAANLRGGGEYGRAWHQAGTRLHKQNVFDDFVAVAEHLVATGVTSPRRLAVHGHSNGGLLVGAVLVQRPDLFGAAVPAVGVLDMLRYHRWTIGYAWAEDYGTADDPDEFQALYAYSPLHNARDGVYPPTLVVTADHDDRVVPAHSFKFAAALQRAQRGPAPVLIRIEERAGHGAAKSLTKTIDEQADLFAFLAWALRVVPVPGLPW